MRVTDLVIEASRAVGAVPFSLICASHDTNYGYGAALSREFIWRSIRGS